MEIITHVLTNKQPKLEADASRQTVARHNIGAVGDVKVKRVNPLTGEVTYESIVSEEASGSLDAIIEFPDGVDISGKADKVGSATAGNFAGLDSAGNLTDSHYKADDFATAEQGAKADTSIQSVSRNSNGKIDVVNGNNESTTVTVYEHPTVTPVEASAVKVGKDALGHTVIGDPLHYIESASVSGSELTLVDEQGNEVQFTGDQNVIEEIQLNGTKIEPDNKTVNIQPTKNDVGLGNVDNTADLDKPISTDTQAALDNKADKVTGGSTGNLVKLDANGNIADSGIASSDVSDAVSKKHEHSNISVLDNTTASYTIAEKNKLAGIEASAQVNKIEHVKLHNIELTISDKTVNIPVETTLANTSNPIASSVVYSKVDELNTAITGITDEYVKNASVNDNTLTITKHDSVDGDTTFTFQGDVNKIEKVKIGNSELSIDPTDKSVTIPYANAPSQSYNGSDGVLTPQGKQWLDNAIQGVLVNGTELNRDANGKVDVVINDVLPTVDDDDLILSGNQSENTPISWKKIVKDYVGDRVSDTSGDQILDEQNDPVFDENAVQLWVSYKDTEFGARRAYEDHTGANIHDTIAAIRQVPVNDTANTMLFNTTATHNPTWTQWSQVESDANGVLPAFS